MAILFKDSETKDNLMRAFAGESQARNRYVFAASQAKEKGLHVVHAVFAFTASQEQEHAAIFYRHLAELAGGSVSVDGSYPVDVSDDTALLLRMAQHNEYEEHDPIYKAFGETARAEGFSQAAASFFQIAEIEKMHGDRFGKFAKLMEEGKLFVSDAEEEWMCLSCGHVYRGTKAPTACPVCRHEQGYFVRLALAPYSPL